MAGRSHVIENNISIWERIWRSGKPMGTFWLEVTSCGEGPVADLPNGDQIIFHEPWPPVELYGTCECKVDVRKAERCIIGKWTGETKSKPQA